MIKVYLLAIFALLRAGFADDDDIPKHQLTINGVIACQDDLPTLSVAQENLVTSKQEWDLWLKNHEFLILGVSDSTCASCCESEPLLHDIHGKVKDKSVLSYPMKTTKKDGKKVIVRKEIPMLRVDAANQALIAALHADGITFYRQTSVHFIKKGQLYEYDGFFGSWNQFAHHAQRLLNPLIYLDDERDVVSFLENKPELYPMDY